jgi:hypothetical protein
MSVSIDAVSGKVLETRESMAKAMLVSYERVDTTSAELKLYVAVHVSQVPDIEQRRQICPAHVFTGNRRVSAWLSLCSDRHEALARGIREFQETQLFNLLDNCECPPDDFVVVEINFTAFGASFFLTDKTLVPGERKRYRFMDSIPLALMSLDGQVLLQVAIGADTSLAVPVSVDTSTADLKLYVAVHASHWHDIQTRNLISSRHVLPCQTALSCVKLDREKHGAVSSGIYMHEKLYEMCGLQSGQWLDSPEQRLCSPSDFVVAEINFTAFGASYFLMKDTLRPDYRKKTYRFVGTLPFVSVNQDGQVLLQVSIATDINLEPEAYWCPFGTRGPGGRAP